MEEIVQRIGAFALAGLASGFSSGLFGIGGGIVRIPIFVYLLPLFGVPSPVLMHVAVGTSMALVLPSALASTRKQLALGNLDLAFPDLGAGDFRRRADRNRGRAVRLD
jgi:uncharacterized protein